MSNSAKVPRIGVGVIILNQGKVLMGKRKNAHGEGLWSFPGGHLEWKELSKECAIRETLEETGLHIHNLRAGPYTEDFDENSEKHYITLFWVGEYTGGVLENKEPHKCEGWEWMNWNQIPINVFLPVQNLLKTDFNPLGTYPSKNNKPQYCI